VGGVELRARFVELVAAEGGGGDAVFPEHAILRRGDGKVGVAINDRVAGDRHERRGRDGGATGKEKSAAAAKIGVRKPTAGDRRRATGSRRPELGDGTDKAARSRQKHADGAAVAWPVNTSEPTEKPTRLGVG
jgi:hypothetical protein